MSIRVATPEDAAGALSIYSQYIDTSITFEYRLPGLEEFSRRISDTLKEFPYLVYIESGKVCGYAYAHRLRDREAYQWGAELSIYLDESITSRGVGQRLYRILIGLLKQQGIKTVYGCVTDPNVRSEKLHEKLGFRKIGTFRNAGFKNGCWRDVSWFEKEIAPYGVPPAAPVPFGALAPEAVAAMIESEQEASDEKSENHRSENHAR